MTNFMFFTFEEYWWFYLIFTLGVMLLLSLDLGVFHKEARSPKFKEAATWSVVWVSLALFFNFSLYQYIFGKVANSPELQSIWGAPELIAKSLALEFLTGYVVEQSLSVDNLFIFVVIFNFFAVEAKYQHRILFYGILGAIIFRAIFIAAGSVLMQYKAVVYFFGAFLILTGIKIFFAPEKKLEPEKNPVIKLLKKFLPVTPTGEGKRFFVRKSGKLHATPLFITLVFVELTDIVFAVDSVPAIYAITKEPFIVFTSNVFAILGLRSLFFVLAGAMDKFHLLKYGLGIVLAFVGLKMVWLDHAFGGKFPIGWSLGIIGAVISGAVVLSFMFPQKFPEK